MSIDNLKLSDKYIAFIKHNAPVEFLEGTTSAGKTTVGIFKFMLKVAENPKKYHIIAAKDTGTAEKNIINKDLGIIDDFGMLTEYNGNGTKDEKIPHILFHTSDGDKVVYVMGYGDKKKWQKALGGQYGCLYIDEINTADIDFVREAAMRCDYFMGTLNPDDPNLPVYEEYINCSRPLPKYKDDAPEELNNMLCEEPKPGWTHWFFSFKDNLALSAEKLEKIMLNVPKGTKLWKNKIQGLRGRATGLVFSNFDRAHHVRSKQWAKQFIQTDRKQEEYYTIFISGLDTSYSSQSSDTIAMTYAGITNKGRYVMFCTKKYNNAELKIPISPSDTAVNYVEFLDRNTKEWGLCRQTFIDSADQATITELAKYKRQHNNIMYIFNPSYKIPIIDRINTQLGWMAYDDEKNFESCFYVVEEDCKDYITELETYSWDESKDNVPEDANDHLINSSQYGWIPYQDKIYHQERSN